MQDLINNHNVFPQSVEGRLHLQPVPEGGGNSYACLTDD